MDTGLPIRTVTELTGVLPVTLRAWERRYGLIRPLRTPKGHRLYTQAHVDLIQRVLALTGRGVPIGQVRRALDAESRAQGKPVAGPWPELRERMRAAVAGFDEQAVETAYNEALSLHPIDRVNRLLLMPLLEELGSRWQKVAGGVAEEHFFSAYLRNKLGARFHHRAALPPSAPRLLAACVPGEHHEIGLLLFALAAHEAGLRVVLLGADVPLGETAAAARRAQCDAVVLSGSLEPSPAFFAELKRLCQSVQRPVYLGGGASAAHERQISAAGATALGTAIEPGVRRIAAELQAKRERA